MAIALDPSKSGVDIGIVVSDSAAALAFYRDTLGLEHVMDMPMPVGGGGTMHRLSCGGSTLKLVCWNRTPEGANPPGGLHTATGLRYITLWITNLDDAAAACAAAGYRVPAPPAQIRPGVRIAMVEDPDGTWVELLEQS
jgi:catechol 2,3-dioxygenase-like lactoylglutathione lyase family enzyme